MLLEKTVNSLSELIAALAELSRQTDDDVVWFRGHARADYKLLPSLARDPKALALESLLSKRFKQNAYPFRQTPPSTEWEWQFLMQHYGVPTRLLDWSETPLVGAYFAVHDSQESHNEHDAHIWAFLPARYNREVCRFTQVGSTDIPSFDDAVLADYLPDRVNISPSIERYPAAALAPRQNERIMAQLGTFTVMHLDKTPLEVLAPNFLARFTVPKESKEAIRRELAALRITRLTLFPELSSVAAVAKEALR
jgi:hypothetical protein